MSTFIKDHAIEALFTLLILMILSFLGFTFQETVSLRARVLSVEQICAAQGAEQKALKESLDQRTEDVVQRIESLSKSLDDRLVDIRDMVKTLIEVLTPVSTAQNVGG